MTRRLRFRVWLEQEKRMSSVFSLEDLEKGDCPAIIGPILQFTGRVDDNGIEIFDGDIVIMKYGFARVYWDKDRAAWMIEFGLDCDTLGHYHKLRVISNIYESPELGEKLGAKWQS